MINSIVQNIVKKRKTYSALLIIALVTGYIFSGSAPEGQMENAAEPASKGGWGQDGGEQTPPKVEVMILASEKIRAWREFSGRLQAVDMVQVRPRVGGTITKISFQDGQIVKAGDAIITIDVRPYEAALRNAEANLAAAIAQEQLAGAELARAKKLIEKKAISQSAYDASDSAYKVAAAQIKSARAAHTQAKLNVEYANITAPISGKISRAEITVGNVIESGSSAPVLTTIVANEELYAEFDVDEQSYVNLFDNSKSGAKPNQKMPVELILVGQTEPSRKGELLAFDNQINSESGTIRARAIFDNNDGFLVAGMFAKIRLGTAEMQEKLLVDEKAVSTDQSKKFVYVVNKKNQVEYREVKLGDSINGKRVVLSGLQAGEKVMVNSLLSVMPSMVVEPVEVAGKPAPAVVEVPKVEPPKTEAKKIGVEAVKEIAPIQNIEEVKTPKFGEPKIEALKEEILKENPPKEQTPIQLAPKAGMLKVPTQTNESPKPDIKKIEADKQ